jgi:hypothetical protein
MPRHQTSRNLLSSDPDEKLEVFRKYAQISLELQEYGSAILGIYFLTQQKKYFGTKIDE